MEVAPSSSFDPNTSFHAVPDVLPVSQSRPNLG